MLLAALKLVENFCLSMKDCQDIDPQLAKAFGTLAEICKQLHSFGEEKLGRLLQRTSHIGLVLGIGSLQTYDEFRVALIKTGVLPVVDCDKPSIPSCYYGWTIEEEDQPDNRLTGEVYLERRGKHLYINGKKVWFKLVRGSGEDVTDEGCVLYQELANGKEKLLPAHILDFLYEYPKFIPEECMGKDIYFWGTVFRDRDGALLVRYLTVCDTRVDYSCHHIKSGLYYNTSVAVLPCK